MSRQIRVVAAVLFMWTGSSYALIRCEVARLTSSDGEGSFGSSAAISGDLIAVGAYLAGGDESGAAYIFRRDGSAWVEEAKLTASDLEPGDRFGHSVSISGDVAVVGSRWDDDACPEDPGCNSGAVYAYRWDSSSWVEEAKLVASDAAAGDWFGQSVSIDGDRVVIGAWYDDDAGEKSGAVYVFRREGANWSQEAKLTASDAAPGDRFGISVSIHQDIVVVGGWWNDDACPGNPDCNSGSAYVFNRDGTTWVEVAKLIGTDTAEGDNFGVSVAASGEYVIVGARYDDDACPPDYPFSCASGSAYVFGRQENAWVQDTKLTASDAARGDMFGHSVSVGGGYAVVGAPGAMAAYLFQYEEAGWRELAKLSPSDVATFGNPVAIDGELAAVGAPSGEYAGRDGSVRVFLLPACVVPTISEWGLISLALLVILAGIAVMYRRRPASGPDCVENRTACDRVPSNPSP